MVKKRKLGRPRKLAGAIVSGFSLDAATDAAIEALVAAKTSTSRSEVVRTAVAAYVATELPAWRYEPTVDPRQLEIPGSRKKDHETH